MSSFVTLTLHGKAHRMSCPACQAGPEWPAARGRSVRACLCLCAKQSDEATRHLGFRVTLLLAFRSLPAASVFFFCCSSNKLRYLAKLESRLFCEMLRALRLRHTQAGTTSGQPRAFQVPTSNACTSARWPRLSNARRQHELRSSHAHCAAGRSSQQLAQAHKRARTMRCSTIAAVSKAVPRTESRR